MEFFSSYFFTPSLGLRVPAKYLPIRLMDENKIGKQENRPRASPTKKAGGGSSAFCLRKRTGKLLIYSGGNNERAYK
jgi:hypothetical protein